MALAAKSNPMKLSYESRTGSDIRYGTLRLLRRMLSPLCGLDKAIGYNIHSPGEPRFLMAGADLTGVHFLRNEASPRPGAYHIGGSGITQDEVLIRTLAETLERYAQVLAEVSRRFEIRFATYEAMTAAGEALLDPALLSFYSSTQRNQPGFPFHRFAPDRPIGWIQARSFTDGCLIWVPAQLLLVGYQPKEPAGEQIMLPSVTTGTAAHPDPADATRRAILELIQIDAAMGHWYSDRVAPQISLDGRCRAISRIIDRQFSRAQPQPRFHWLQSPDLPAFAIACVLKGPPGSFPAIAVGLGCALELEKAMYHALVEAVAVAQLAKVVSLYDRIDRASGFEIGVEPTRILDLDRNVAFYARPEPSTYVDGKFDAQWVMRASDLPQDREETSAAAVRTLIDGFRRADMDLLAVNLTTADVATLGFTVARVWSPHTLSLCLPSAPPLAHPRFAAYGGAQHENPHPYP